MKTKITIEKIELHDGQEFRGTPWKHQMQILYTNNGLYIDNSEGKCFRRGCSGFTWEGINWEKYMGKTVEIIVVDCVGNELVNFTPYNFFEDLIRDSGRHPHCCPNHLWAYPLFLLGHLI
jgi:hypothetical protein